MSRCTATVRRRGGVASSAAPPGFPDRSTERPKSIFGSRGPIVCEPGRLRTVPPPAPAEAGAGRRTRRTAPDSEVDASAVPLSPLGMDSRYRLVASSINSSRRAARPRPPPAAGPGGQPGLLSVLPYRAEFGHQLGKDLGEQTCHSAMIRHSGPDHWKIIPPSIHDHFRFHRRCCHGQRGYRPAVDASSSRRP